MKNSVLFFALALALAFASIGCSADGRGFSLCRRGSAYPIAGNKQVAETVYVNSGSSITPCSKVSACDPCEPAACNPCSPCQPCEPACATPCEPACATPCEPACNPCSMSCVGGSMINYSGIATPHPSSN